MDKATQPNDSDEEETMGTDVPESPDSTADSKYPVKLFNYYSISPRLNWNVLLSVYLHDMLSKVYAKFIFKKT